MELLIQGFSLPDTYHKSLIALSQFGEFCSCPDYNTTQKELSITMVVLDPLREDRISKLWVGGPEDLMQYEMEILDGILDFRIGSGWDYTYHNRIIHNNQYENLIKELKRNPYSRRAVLAIRRPEDFNTNDPPCLQHIQFFIRDGKLNMIVVMRSNDALKAAFMNMWAFIRLQEKIAAELGVPVGTYTHRANSYHCYERDFEMFKQFRSAIYINENITFSYKDMFREAMEECIPRIKAKVAELRERS